MSTLKEDNVFIQTPTPGSTSAGLDIPEAMDGFFGYTEEKSLKQVLESLLRRIIALNRFT